jgi:Ca-activated chloride channel family protein
MSYPVKTILIQRRFLSLIGCLSATLAMLFGSGPACAGYSVLGGAPVTQGQMLISDEDYQRVHIPETKSSSKQGPLFQLRETRVEAEISGVLARVRVSQVFQNPFSDSLEALYVFPLPENSAVDAYSLQIGERLIVGEVKEREEARQVYQQARQEGRKAALLEQERANIFTQSVANIPANSEVVIHLEYVQPLEVDDDRYLYRFPMVVGSRYIPGTPVNRPNVGRGWARDTDLVPDASRITTPRLPEGMRNGSDVSITVTVDGAMPIQEITPVTHELDISRQSETKSVVSLKNQSVIPDQDFVFEYRLASEQTTLASMVHRASAQKGGYVMLALQPKWSVEQNEIAPREVNLVLDISGSMRGQPISQLRQFATEVLDALNPQDTFQIIAFSQSARAFRASAIPADAANVAAGKDFIRNLNPSGGTNLLSALQLALGKQQEEDAAARYLFLMTDALVGNDHGILGYLREQQFQDARVFPIAFGAAPNDYLIKRAAEIGRGFSMQITNQDNPVAIAKQFNALTNSPYMTDLQIDWGDLVVEDQVPERLPDLFSGKPLIVLGRYDQSGSSKVVLRGNVQGNAVELELDLELPELEPAHDSIGSVWARQRIRQIWNQNVGKETSQSRAEITALGLQHQLVTAYTSFIAVEKELEQPLDGKLVMETESDESSKETGVTASDSSSVKNQTVDSKKQAAKKSVQQAVANQTQHDTTASTTKPAATPAAPASRSAAPVTPSTSSSSGSAPSYSAPSSATQQPAQYRSAPSGGFGAGSGRSGGGPIGPFSALLSLAGAGAAAMLRRKNTSR